MVDAEAVERRLREIDRRIAAARRIQDAGRAAFLAEDSAWTPYPPG